MLEIWETIREDYYKTSNPKQYETDLEKQRRIELLRVEIAGCTAGVIYFEVWNEILPIFKEFGYDVRDVNGINKVRKKLLVKKTKLTLLVATQEAGRKKTDNGESISFWKQLADVEDALGRQILDIESVTVIRWINLINQIREKNERNNRKR